MTKLWFTTVQFCDDNENEYEASVLYYVDKCLDTRRDFIDDFEIKQLDAINVDAPLITKKQAYSKFYEQIMNAIVENPGEVAEEF
jgi:hypothetical protein